MQDAQIAKPPVHLWIVGLLGLLWNGFGCYDYLMTRMRNLDYFRSMMPDVDPQAILAWIDSFPIYAQFGWGLGVWMGLLGSLLLLMRNRWAVPVLGLSLLGAVLGLGYQIFLAPPPPAPSMTEGAMAAMPWVIILIAALLYYYAHRQKQAGVLR
jgi:uncharacterized MnhB-related membrane protein